jgi:putative glutamine amidotransferase
LDALFKNGALPILIPSIEDKQVLMQYLDMVSFIIIIGGLDYPPFLYKEKQHPKTEPMEMHRAISDLYLLDLALKMGKPVLGICAGMQLINISFGGKLIQHLDNVDIHYGEKMHDIYVQKDSYWLSQIIPEGKILVNSNHHQGVDPTHIGKGLKVAAVSSDGCIEALEYNSEQMILGIQWHPERMQDTDHRYRLFDFIIHFNQ